MSNEIKADKVALIMSTMEKLSDDIKCAFGKMKIANKNFDSSMKIFKICIQEYFDKINKELKIGEYKVARTKIPRKLKKKMKKERKYLLSIIKVDEIESISTTIEVK